MNIRVVRVGALKRKKTPLQGLYEGLFRAVFITKHRKTKAVAVRYYHLVIDSDSSWLIQITAEELWLHFSQLVMDVSNGHFIQVTKHGRPYLCLVPADWYFDQQKLLKTAR